MIKHEDLLNLAIEVVHECGRELRSSTPLIESSVGKDIKLDVDKKSHEIIMGKLRGSGIPILSEEGDDVDIREGNFWVVDPLDGSLNFSRGIPLSSVSIALMEKGEPVLGVVYDFNREETFSGIV